MKGSLGIRMVAVALLLFSAVSAGAQMQGSADLVQQRRFAEAVEQWRAGDARRAFSLFDEFVSRYADSPLAQRALIYKARISWEEGEPGQCLTYLDRLDEAARLLPESRVVQGLCMTEAGFSLEGAEVLLELEPETLAPEERSLRLLGLADAHQQQGQGFVALAFLGKLQGGDALDARASRIARRILLELNESDLALAVFMYGESPLGLDARLQQAHRARARGDLESAQRLVESVIASPLKFAYRAEAVRLLDELMGITWLNREAIGVVLPLSGRYAPFGNLVRRGMELALARHRATGAPGELLFRDGSADPEQAAAAFKDLAEGERVMAVAGPLTAAASEVMARQAQLLSVPLLSLSQKIGLPQTGDYVFRNFITNRQQARVLARYAVVERGMTSFGVLYPDNKLGREMTALFAKEVLRLGGLVTVSQSYAETETDFRRQINLLRGRPADAPLESDGRKKPLSEQELLLDLFEPDPIDFPAVDFDALFIPDYAERVGVIAPQLAFYGIDRTPLLGINVWNSPELVRLGRQYVEGAVFVDGFFLNSPLPQVQDFVAAYRQAYGEDPSILEAQAYDIADMLLGLVADQGIQSREDFVQGLSSIVDYPGVTGRTSFGAFGEAEKDLFLLQIRKGSIVQIPR